MEASSKTNRRSKPTTEDRSTKPKQEVPNTFEKKITVNSSFKEEMDSVASLDETRDNMKPRKIEFGTLKTMEWSEK